MREALFLILVLVFSLFPCKGECRSNHQLRVGTLHINESTYWILVGISNPTLESFESKGFWTEPEKIVGFSSLRKEPYSKPSDPKFIIEVEKGEVSRVRAFELGSHLPSNGLPTVLIDVPDATQQKRQHAALNGLAFVGKSLGFPLAPLTSLTTIPRRKKELKFKFQAYYLMELIDKALITDPDQGFPELKNAFNEDEEKSKHMLRKLGQALLTRYHPQSNWQGIHVPSQNTGEFYEEWRTMRAGHRNTHASLLIRVANEQGLFVKLMGNDFAILSSKPFTSDLPLNSKILSLVSFVNPEGSVELVNFNDPIKIKNTLNQIDTQNFYMELVGGGIIPLSNLIVKAVQKGLKDTAARNHQSDYLKRIEAYGAFQALLETQYYSLKEINAYEKDYLPYSDTLL